uniref:Alginate lyase 2 domain-containing protein n=1 Tax=Aegilops tauschii TaxID=37682 RepID=M8B2Z0_AEGTA
MAKRLTPWISVLVVLSTLWHSCSPAAGADPTAGFTAVETTEDRFKLHKPYDLPQEQRYELCADGMRRFWVYCDDKPFRAGSPTKPRSEILLNVTYNSGVWQFEGYGYVPAGTTGVSVMQVFGAAGPPRNTTRMLHVYGGRLVYYNDEAKVVDDHIYDRWFRLNVVHDVQASALTVFIDGDKRLVVPGYGGDLHYFKFGVYTQTDPSHYMESRWRDVKVYTKTPY